MNLDKYKSLEDLARTVSTFLIKIKGPYTSAVDGSTGGFKAGAGNDVQWYRGAANVWQTPDYVYIDLGLKVGSGVDYTPGQSDIACHELYLDIDGAGGGILFGDSQAARMYYYGVGTCVRLNTHFRVDGDLYTAGWTDYSSTSTVTGWSSFTTKNIHYKKLGNLVFVLFQIEGTSNSTTTSFTLPYYNVTGPSVTISIPAVDNGSIISNACMYLASAGVTASFYTNINSATFTASGQKKVRGQFWYQHT